MKKKLPLKLYVYGFIKQNQSIVIEAYSLKEARLSIWFLLLKLNKKGFSMNTLCDEKVKKPVTGVSRKNENGQIYVWSKRGWKKES